MTQNQYLPERILIPHFGLEKPIVGVEIGVLGASGTVAMLNRIPNLKLYAIDPWLHIPGKFFEAEQNQEYHDINYQESINRTKEFGDRVILMKMTSDEAFKLLDGSFDFVWIDGAHDEENVRSDVQKWKTRIKLGGIIGGHDIQIEYIAKIVKEELGEYQVGEDFTWWHIHG
jgi:predicted O-methyltransferase YrrM